MDSFLFERFYTRMTLEHLEYCHSLTHYTLVQSVHSILRCGIIPQQRAVYFHPFPDHHPHHTQSSRSDAPVMIRIKKEALFMLHDLWQTPCRSVLCEHFIPRSLIQYAFLRPRKARFRSDDWRTEQDVADGHYTSRNDRTVPICIFDCGLAPFPIQHVLQADSNVVPPLEEDVEKTSGFKVPKSANPRDEFLDRTLWLSDMVNAEEVRRLTEVV